MKLFTMFIAWLNVILAGYGLYSILEGHIREYVITSGYIIWFIFYFALLISLGVLSLIFANKKTVRNTVPTDEKIIILINTLATGIILFAGFDLTRLPAKYGTTNIWDVKTLLLNLAVEVISMTLSVFLIITARQFYKNQDYTDPRLRSL